MFDAITFQLEGFFLKCPPETMLFYLSGKFTSASSAEGKAINLTVRPNRAGTLTMTKRAR